MAQELQHLLTAIQKDGVDKAQAESERILNQARAEAKTIIEKSKAEAALFKTASEKEAEVFRQRGESALGQAARDVLISLGKDMENLIKACVGECVSEAYSVDAVKDILSNMANLFFEHKLNPGAVEVIVSQEDQETLSSFVNEKLRSKFEDGVVVRVNDKLKQGFHLSFQKKDLYCDFSAKTVADALCISLRPQLQAIVRKAADSQGSTE